MNRTQSFTYKGNAVTVTEHIATSDANYPRADRSYTIEFLGRTVLVSRTRVSSFSREMDSPVRYNVWEGRGWLPSLTGTREVFADPTAWFDLIPFLAAMLPVTPSKAVAKKAKA